MKISQGATISEVILSKVLVLLLVAAWPLNAAIISEDPEDAISVEMTHLGAVGVMLLSLGDDTSSLAIDRDDFPMMIGVNQTFSVAYSQGECLETFFGTDAIFYLLQGNFSAGAAAGLNYAKLDLDQDGAFETVIEFDTGAGESALDDRITRYAYDSEGGDLSIPNAISAMDQTLFTYSCLVEIVGISRSSDGQVTLSWVSHYPPATNLVLRATTDLSLPLDDWQTLATGLKATDPESINVLSPEGELLEEEKLFFVISP